MKEYAGIVEKVQTITQPIFPTCRVSFSTGKTLEEIEAKIREAIELHLEGRIEDGLPIPESTSVAIEIGLPAEPSLA